jgi:hypothetical protein
LEVGQSGVSPRVPTKPAKKKCRESKTRRDLQNPLIKRIALCRLNTTCPQCCIKPSKHDPRYKLKIQGTELAVFHKMAVHMCEAYGLDRKVWNYKGTRAMTFYSWDLDCIEAVLRTVLQNPARDGITTPEELAALQLLDIRFQELIQLSRAPS